MYEPIAMKAMKPRSRRPAKPMERLTPIAMMTKRAQSVA